MGVVGCAQKNHRRVPWKVAEDIKLVALCCDPRARSKVKLNKVGFDWKWIAQHAGMHLERCVRRYLPVATRIPTDLSLFSLHLLGSCWLTACMSPPHDV
jgi:hypothetical protein